MVITPLSFKVNAKKRIKNPIKASIKMPTDIAVSVGIFAFARFDLKM